MNNTERIIGSCLELNGEIVSMSFNSNLPKFLAKIREFYFKRKLINSVKKLKKANTPLTTDNVMELFNYIYSNFPPFGSYKNIKSVIHTDKTDIWRSSISKDDIVYIIEIDTISKGIMNITIHINDENGNGKTITCYLKELKTEKEYAKKYINSLNSILINIIMEYILDTIDSTSLEIKKVNNYEK